MLGRLLGDAVTVEAPGRLAQPVVLRSWWSAEPRFEDADGTPLPRDRWGNWVAERPDGGRAQVERAYQWSQLAPAVRVDGVVVPGVRPLARGEQVVLVLYVLAGVLSGGLGGLALLVAGLVAARVLHDRRPRPHRRLRAAVPLVVGVAVLAGLVALVRALGWRG